MDLLTRDPSIFIQELLLDRDHTRPPSLHQKNRTTLLTSCKRSQPTEAEQMDRTTVDAMETGTGTGTKIDLRLAIPPVVWRPPRNSRSTEDSVPSALFLWRNHLTAPRLPRNVRFLASILMFHNWASSQLPFVCMMMGVYRGSDQGFRTPRDKLL
ncbi:hypothetical protein K457DRAFT_594960 [Linnemannia elongata AG-77]|uniref:Uncharacterized protein n=1 Tax=Linnemannia elongata AG-77 TaxID=1314771 RepID=A0A197JS79_9FUNG|nr:hypothetical protein K457DRAFT_594960 [Linnemannia elongata AG-77]